MKKILFMKAVTIEGNKHSLPLLKAEKFGRHNVDTGHEVTFKAGEFWGKGKVVTHGKDGCTVADETGREHSVHWNEVSKNHSEKLAKAHVKGFTRKDGSFVREHDDSRTAADFHEHQAVEHYSASTYALRADDEKGEKAHDKAGSAHEKAMRAHKAGDANAAELSAAAKKASDVADSLHDRAKIKSQASSARSASAMKHGDAFSNDNLPKKGTRVTDSYGKKGEVINSTGSQVVIHHDDGATSNNHPTKVFLHKEGAATSSAEYVKPDHVKNKTDEYDHLSKIPAEKRSDGEKARIKKIVSQAGLGKHSAEYKAHINGK